jgi:hypothetical protein
MQNLPPKTKPVQLKIVIPIIIGAILGVALLLSNPKGETAKAGWQRPAQTNNPVATDAAEQYKIAERAGDRIRMRLQASRCASAYLQAKDEKNYQKWLNIQREAEEELGLLQN